MADSIYGDAQDQLNKISAQSSTSSDDPVILFSSGNKTFTPAVPGEIPGRVTSSGGTTKSASQIQREILAAAANRNPNYNTWVDVLLRGGFTSKSRAKIPLYVASDAMNAIKMYQAYSVEGGRNSFQDWMISYVQSAPQLESAEGSGGYSGPVTTTTVSITDENTAEALLDKYARDLLGRGLTKQETQKYIKDFNKAEAAAPQVTTSAGSGATRTSTTETAASKEELLRQVVSSNPDYAKFQVDTTIVDMLMDDIQKAKVMIRG